jgi:hypothetical protein
MALTLGPLVWLVVDTLLGLLGAERLFRRRGETSPLSTSYRIALGMGLHNLGEELAIGAAFALGEAAVPAERATLPLHECGGLRKGEEREETFHSRLVAFDLHVPGSQGFCQGPILVDEPGQRS